MILEKQNKKNIYGSEKLWKRFPFCRKPYEGKKESKANKR